MKARWVALAALVLAWNVSAEEAVFAHPQDAEGVRALLSVPAQALERAQSLQGQFVQRRFLHELPQPLRSQGDFLFARGLGIIWHTRQPLDSEFVLTPDGMRQSANGRLAAELSTAQQPGLQIALKLFMALFSLDVTALAEDFELYGQAQPAGGWQVGLRPRQAALGEVFGEAVISGASAVQRIELRDHSGDRTEIVIQQMQSAGQISAETRQRYAR